MSGTPVLDYLEALQAAFAESREINKGLLKALYDIARHSNDPIVTGTAIEARLTAAEQDAEMLDKLHSPTQRVWGASAEQSGE